MLRVESLKWSESGQTALSADEVRHKLQSRLTKWQTSLHDGKTWEDPMAGEQLIADFDEKCTEWSSFTFENPSWRRAWACKEVLKHVRMTLAQSKPGWWSPPDAGDRPVDWTRMTDNKTRDGHDRYIERTIQPDLVKAALQRVGATDTFDLREELESLANLIRNA